MKQYYHSTSKKPDPKYNSMDTCFTQDEIDVANILLDLPNLIKLSEENTRPLRWVVKKKRSVPSLRVVEEDKPQPQPKPRAKVDSTSPSTPLSFYPSESDDKSSHRNKRTREELMEEIDGLTQTRKLLTMEVENERRRFNELKSLNLAMKEKKSEASSSGVKKEKSGFGIISNGSLNVGLKLDQQSQYYPSLIFANHQQQLTINNSICESSQAASARVQFTNHGQLQQLLSSNGGGGLSVNQGGPLGIPDLNIGLEEECFQPLDHNRVFVDDTAEARRRRMSKIKDRRKRQQQQRVR